LEHHGIKGQKWGVRRYQNEDGSLTNAGQKRYMKETQKKNIIGTYAKKAFNKVKDKTGDFIDDRLDRLMPSRMSDQELREKINRLSMEKQYRQLLAEEKRARQKPKKEHTVLKKVAETAGNTLLSVAATIAKTSLQVYTDDVFAPKRMERAEKRNALPPDATVEDFRFFSRKASGGKKK
jgi:hypothetical protein